jgi:hypothetical protein
MDLSERDHIGFTQIAYTNFPGGENGRNELRFTDLTRGGATVTVADLIGEGASGYDATDVTSPEMRDWTIDAVFDTDDANDGRNGGGVVAYVMSDGSGTAMIAFRGTSQDFEWAQDIEIINATQTRHQQDIETFLTENWGLLSNYQSISLTGHSLGGNDAEYAAISLARRGLGNRIDSVYNMDGPGHSQEFFDEYAPEIEQLQGRFHHRIWSWVGSLLKDIPGCDSMIAKTSLISLFDGSFSNLFIKHDTKFLAYDENGNMIPGSPDALMGSLSELSVRLDDAPSGIGNAASSVLRFIVTSVFEAKDFLFDDEGNLTPEGIAVIIPMTSIAVCITPLLSVLLTVVVTTFIAAHYEFILATITALISAIKSLIARSIEQLASFVSTVLAWAKQTITNIVGFFKGIGEWITGTATTCINAIGGFFSRSLDWINKQVRAAYKGFVQIARQTREAALHLSRQVQSSLIDMALHSWLWTRSTVESILSQTRGLIDSLLPAFISDFAFLPVGAFVPRPVFSTALAASFRQRDFTSAKKQELLNVTRSFSSSGFWQAPEQMWKRTEYLASEIGVSVAGLAAPKAYVRNALGVNNHGIQRIERVFAQAYETDGFCGGRVLSTSTLLRQVSLGLLATTRCIRV